MIFRVIALWGFLSALALDPATAANNDFAWAVSKVPDDCNVIALVNAESIRKSSFYASAAKSEGDSPFPGLVSVNQFVAASRWRLPEGPAIYETMIVNLNGVSASQIVNRSESASEANPLPRGTLPVVLAADTLGLYYPADRQAAKRWAASTAVNDPSAYLSQGIGYAQNNDTQIVFAVDLHDALDAASLRKWIEGEPFAGSKQLNPQGAANLIASLRGCTMGIKCTDRATASWRFDFGSGVASLKLVAKPLMLDLVDRLGLSLSAMSNWDATADGNVLMLKGELQASDLRVLMSVLAQSPETLDRLKLSADDNGSAKPTLSKADSTKMHYDMLTKILRDITHPTQSILTSGAKANYLERYARKIDELPLLNVDEDSIQASAEIAMRLRVQAERLRGNQITAGTYSNNSQNDNSGYGYGGYGYGGYSNGYGVYNASAYGRQYGLTEQQVAARLGRANSAASGIEQKKEIANMIAELRRTLTERYQVEF